MQFLEINKQHYVAIQHIREVSVTGFENNAEINIIMIGEPTTSHLIYRQFHSRPSETQTAFNKAERALAELISTLNLASEPRIDAQAAGKVATIPGRSNYGI